MTVVAGACGGTTYTIAGRISALVGQAGICEAVRNLPA